MVFVMVGFLLLFFSGNSLAFPSTVNPDIVTIIDNQIKSPLPGVTVYNSERSYTAVSDIRGQINIAGLALTDSLYFEFPTYTTLILSIKDIRSRRNTIYMDMAAVKLGGVVIMASSKFAERSEDIPSMVEAISSEQVAFKNPQTSADMLSTSANIFVQKSQMGGGSPIIRGFEANKLVIVIDGVRMNNAIYRNGHLQNVISIDNSILDRTEVIYGPATVMYGSDALGGVMHFYTRDPMRVEEGEKNWELNAYTRFSSANLEKTGHWDFNIGNEKWASLTSFSVSDFEDLRSGSRKGTKLPPGFGDRNYYTTLFEGRDTILPNPNPRIQIGTSYRQLDVVQKILFQPKDSLKFVLNMQYSTTSDLSLIHI